MWITSWGTLGQNTIPLDGKCNLIVIAAQEWEMLVGKRNNKKVPFWIIIGWKPLGLDGFKLNMDGASRNNSTHATTGVLVRDHNGNWIMGFYRNIGASTSLGAEIWGLHDCLWLATNFQLQVWKLNQTRWSWSNYLLHIEIKHTNWVLCWMIASTSYSS